ncbi:MAG: leucine-rich repeat domain-containing protein [Clostridia bacterium]|nr:leucine-rich repeat domain-containing protein [Clostridia bacterium]
MNNHNRFDILSGIAQDIIDSCTMRRAKLLAGKNKTVFFKKPFFKVALAAVLCISIGLPLLWMLLGSDKQVPVYQGMTVSSESPASMQDHSDSNRYFALYDTVLPDFAILAHKDQGLHDNRPNEKTTAADGSTLALESGAQLYYAKQNEDFYITVHIDNPDKFEILSFTLNGEKYSSYMFEPGSNMENLILKCNVGDANGIVEYTIDAIKYVDDTEIKDVRMEGDQTVKVGVYTEEQPVASFAEPEIGFGEIGIDVTINDPYGIMSLLESEAYAILYKDGAIVDRQAVNITEPTSIRFAGLDDGTEYRIAVIANYDAFDGSGKTEHTIGERKVTTPTILTLQVSDVSYTEATCKLVWHEDVSDKTAVPFVLYKGSEKIRNLSGNEVKLTDLLSGTEYTLKVEYTHNGTVKSREVTFTTKTVGVPSLFISDLQPDLHSVSYKLLKENDPLDLLTIDKVELKQGDSVIATATGTTVEFTDLELLQTYTVEVTYSYDLFDGSGKQTKTITQRFGTQSKGLEIKEGWVTGIGTCTDKEIYVNMPIGPSAFYDTQITKVTMGSGVTSIYPYAFALCSNLKRIIIPETVTQMEYGIFSYSNDLVICCEASEKPAGWHSSWNIDDHTDVWNPKECKTVWNGREYQTDSQGIHYVVLNNGNMVVTGFNNAPKRIALPEGVTEICNGAFRDCTSLQEIYLPKSLEFIGDSAFANCSELREIVMPPQMISIGNECFKATAITKITIPEGITFLSNHLFANCEQLTEVHLPDSLKEIGSGVFNNCSALKQLEIPNGVERIGVVAFQGCSDITIKIPASVQHIANQYFSYDVVIVTEHTSKPNDWYFSSDDIENVTFFWNFKEFHTDSQGVTYALKNDGTAELVSYNGKASTIVLGIDGYQLVGAIPEAMFAEDRKLKILVIPEGITRIGDLAFSCCYSLQKVELPGSLKDIGAWAFGYCSSIESLTIPDGVETIGSNAFWDCSLIKSLTIPQSVKTIGENAFYGYSLIIRTAFESQPAGWHDDWIVGDYTVTWGITELKTDSQGVTYALKNDGTAELVSYNGNNSKIVLGISGYKLVGAIPREMFIDNRNLVEIVIPEGITAIEFMAFAGCTQLQTITLPNSLKSIDELAFSECYITELIIPESVETIEALAFPVYHDGFIIYCEAPAKPVGWHDEWVNESVSVVWGYTG